jgi:hypothetical protein
MLAPNVLSYPHFASSSHFSLRSGSSKFGVGNNGGIPLLIFSLWFIFSAVFCVFTPSSAIQRIAIHFFLLGVAGTYTVLSGDINSLRFFIVFSVITLLCTIGSAFLFGYNFIWSRVGGTGSSGPFGGVGACSFTGERCGEDYLTWIRIITTFDIYLLIFAIVIALGGYQSSHQVKA